MTQQRGGLGRGLSALLPPDAATASVREIPIDDVVPNPRQPRRAFDPSALEDLASSIRAVGVLQPVIVRRAGEGFELVVGERRLRAARMAGLDRVPAIVRETADDSLLRDALIENVQRADLNPLEEAAAYRNLVDDLGATHEEIAARVGKSRAAVTNSLRLLGLAPAVQERIASGAISGAHGRAIAGLSDQGAQVRASQRVVAEGLSVRATEELVRRMAPANVSPASPGRLPAPRATGIVEAEARLSDILETRVRVEAGRRGKGRIVIEFGGSEDLDRLMRAIAERAPGAPQAHVPQGEQRSAPHGVPAGGAQPGPAHD